MKVAIVGCGAVGSSAAYAIVMSGAASEVVMIDINEKLARAQAEDILHATPFVRPARIVAGGYPQAAGSDVVVLCCGAGQRPGESRLELLSRNAAIFNGVVAQVIAYAPGAASGFLEAACLSLPRVVGGNGVEATVQPSLTPEEKQAIARSAQILREAADNLALG